MLQRGQAELEQYEEDRDQQEEDHVYSAFQGNRANDHQLVECLSAKGPRQVADRRLGLRGVRVDPRIAAQATGQLALIIEGD